MLNNPRRRTAEPGQAGNDIPSPPTIVEVPPPASPRWVVNGIPDGLPDKDVAIARSRLTVAIESLSALAGRDLALTISPAGQGAGGHRDEGTPSQGSLVPRDPMWSMRQLVLPEDVRDSLEAAMSLIRNQHVLFDDWGLGEIEPYPRAAINFHGAPGTGKTMAAHAVASALGRKILVASYAEIESKYHGDGPKNVKSLFSAAEEANAVLFIDEADSLLSRRLNNVTQGSEQAINSMRSQLLINLEQFSGLVIFSTNLVTSYDKAFETRVRHIEFTLPDAKARAQIWRNHLVARLPLAIDVDPDSLGYQIEDLCGRDIKNAIVDAASRAAADPSLVPITQAHLHASVQRLKGARIQDADPVTSIEKHQIATDIRRHIAS